MQARCNRTVLLLAALWVSTALAQQPSSGPSAQSQPTAQQQTGLRSEAEIRLNAEVQSLLREIEEHLRSQDWVRTDIRQEVTLMGFKFSAEGEYVVGPGNLMRLHFRVKLSDTEGELLEVCDGRDQWHVQTILDVQKVEHLNFEQVEEVLSDPDFDPEQRRAFRDARGLNGLAPFVRILREFFVFNRREEGEWQGRKVIIVHGTWNEARLGGLERSSEQQGTQQREQERYSLLNLPAEMPSAISVWIDPEQKWVYRVEMIAERAPKTRPSRILFEFNNPVFGQPVERSYFTYRPPDDVRPEDRTPIVVDTLQLVLQQAKAAKQQAGTRQPTTSGATGGLLGPARKEQPKNTPKEERE